MKYFFAKSVAPLFSKAIQAKDFSGFRDQRRGRIRNSPWVKIPNVGSFEIKVSIWDPIFLAIGIKKRKDKAGLVIKPYKNGAMNRYMEHQIRRLDEARQNPVLYWKTAEILMRRSNVFRVAAIQHVFHN